MSRSVMSPNSPVTAALLAPLAAVLFLLPAQADEADDQYAVASGHYVRDRWELAAEEFQTFVQKYPNHPKANQGVFFLAEALVQLGRCGEAATHFRDYLSREPDGSFARPALFRAGEADYLAGKLESARRDLEKFSTDYAEDELNAYVLPYLGDILLSQDDAASAEERFRDALRRFPQGPMQDECRFGLARALEKRGKTVEAERFYMAVAAKTGRPLADDAQFHLGALQYASERFEEAVQAFETFESTMADSSWQSTARLGHGWALLKLRRLEEARQSFEKITSDSKVGVDARYWLGLTQKAQKDWAAAAQTLIETAADHPTHHLAPALRFHAGDSLICAGDAAGATQQFDQVMNSGPIENEWIDDAMRGKVQAALRIKDHQAVDRQVAEFARRCPESPLHADVQRMLARSLLERKQHKQAIGVLEPLIAAGDEAKGQPEDRYLLSLAYAGAARHQDALDVLLPVVDSVSGGLKADAQQAEAALLMKLERFDEAIPLLTAFLASQPAGDEAVTSLGNLAICHVQANQLDKAKEVFARLLEEHPKHPRIGSVTEQLAEAAYDAGDPAWASRLFTRLVDEDGSSKRRLTGLSGLGWSQHKLGQLEEAAATFGQFLREGPDPLLAAEAALARGQILEQLGQPDPALAMYDLVAEQYANTDQFPQALWAAARLRDRLDQDQEAAALYERLAKTFPEFPEIDAVLYNWAWALHDLGREEASVSLFDRLRRERPNSAYQADAAFRVAQSAFAAGDYERSGKLVSEVLAGQPNAKIRENTLYLRGQIAAAEQRWDEASQSFETLLGDYPESSLRLLAEYGLAEAAFRQNDYQAAWGRFDRLSRQTGGSSERWLAIIPLRLAQTLCHQKRWDEAYAIASKIEAEYPDFEEQYEVDYVIGRCLSTRGEFESAREAYRRVIRSSQGAKTETAAKSQLMIAESYYHQKSYEAALREYLALEILYDYPTWQAAALFQAGKCHEMLGEWKQAVDQYSMLLKTYPESSFTEEATERLQAAKQRAAEPTF